MSDLDVIENNIPVRCNNTNNSKNDYKKDNNSIKKPFKNLVIITLMLVLLFIVTISFLTILICFKVFQLSDLEYKSLYFNNKISKSSNICTSKSCIRAANLILENLNESVDPCEDFYEFSCGSFSNSKRLRDDQTKIDEFSILRDKLAFTVADLLAEPIYLNDSQSMANAKTLYQSCIDEPQIESFGVDNLLNIINKELGGWPILENDILVDQNEQTTILNRLIKLRKYDLAQIVEVFVGPNPKDPKANILRITQPSWFFNKEYLYDEKIMFAYKNFMLNIITFLTNNSQNRDLVKEINGIFELEREFSILQQDDGERKMSVYKNMTIKELSNQIPDFDWLKYVNGIFQEIPNVNITENETILVDDIKYLADASKLYANLIKYYEKDFQNLLIWIFVREAVFFLPKYFQDAKLEFDKLYDGAKLKPSRSLLCSNFVNSKMEFAVGRIYVSKYFDSDAKYDATEMISNIMLEFRSILNSTDWMDSDSKKAAIDKLDSIDSKIGYTDDILNNTFLDNYYDGFNFSHNNLFDNYCKISKLITKIELAELRKKHNPKNWISGPAVVNAFYSATSNQICFPAGILQSPFYDYSNPKYLNYGAIGTVIGHEITHGFDDQGRLYDKDGVFFSDEELTIWTNKTVEMYKEKAQCIMDQFDNFLDKQINKNLNGLLTLSENIADSGGLKQAFLAYKKWKNSNKKIEPHLPGLEKYTQDQLFFISFGQLWCGKIRDEALFQSILNDPHSPGKYRVIGSTSNVHDFGKVFNCKLGSKNNPINKCSVW